ncbi:MAG: hypothetical protein ACRDND_23740, partial [Streptosporangiaceae bacterium]
SDEDAPRDIAALVIPLTGSVQGTGDVFVPYRLCDAAGAVVEPVSAFLAELQASGRSEATLKSYCKAMLRFLSALGVSTGVGVSSDDSLGRCRSVATPGGPVSRFPAIRAA